MRFRFQYLVLAIFVIMTLAVWQGISSFNAERFDLGESHGEYGRGDNEEDNPNNSEDRNENIIVDKEDLNEGMLRMDDNRKERLQRLRKFPVRPREQGDQNLEQDFRPQEHEEELSHIRPRNKKETNEDVGGKDTEDDKIPSFDDSVLKSHINTDDAHHDKWIVLTSIAPPTEDVKFLANLTDWKVVVVGDTKTPQDWSYPNCVYLSVARQEGIGFSLTKRLPYKNYARKNAGYLYAIAHGAKVIYETDDDNRPLDKLQSFVLDKTTSGLMFAGTNIFNPYRHFGQPTLWPRGYPLGKVGAETTSLYRLHEQWRTPIIQQGVVNGDPDMDAIFRLTRKLTLKPLDVKFDPAAPPVLLPAGVFSPFNSQNTLFLKDAFWALLIPTTTTFRICDIWRGYWAQRLLWEINGRLGFFPPNAYQERNAHDYMADMEEENDMYYNTDRLLTFLTQWKCPTTLTFFQCAYKLSRDMASEKFLQQADVEITKLWLQDLIRAGYTEPKRISLSRKNDLLYNSENKRAGMMNAAGDLKHLSEVDLEERHTLTLNRGIPVKFVAAIQTPPSISEDNTFDISAPSRHADSIARMCPGVPVVSTPTHSITKRPGSPFSDILLTIVFNSPFFGNIRYLETMYRPLFPNILYCGSNFTLFMRDTAFLHKNLSYVDGTGIGRGYFNHWCAMKAMQIKFNVKGYLFTADDALLNPWNFAHFDKNKIWMTKERYIFNVSANTHWMWWSTNMGSSAYYRSIEALKNIALSEENRKSTNNLTPQEKLISTMKDNSTLSNRLIHSKEFLANLHRNTGNPQYSVHAISDIYYIPRRLSSSAVVYLNHFYAHHVFVELSVPVTLFGLDNATNFEIFTGVNLWMEERSNPWPRFTVDNHFLHPVKLSMTENLLPLCTAYLPALLAKGHSL